MASSRRRRATHLPPPPHLSKSIVSFVQASLVNFHSRIKTGKATSLDATYAASSLKLLFSHMRETGYNDYLQHILIAQLASIESGTGGQEFMDRIRRSLPSGMEVDDSEIQAVVPTNQDRIAFVSKLRGIGLQGIEEEIVSQFVDFGKLLPASYSGNSNVYFKTVGARVLLVNCGASATLLGILALASPPPLDVVCAIGSAIYGVLSLAGVC